MCLRQLLKVGDNQKSKGNCSICIADEFNKNCVGYIPLKIFEVKENVKKEKDKTPYKK